MEKQSQDSLRVEGAVPEKEGNARAEVLEAQAGAMGTHPLADASALPNGQHPPGDPLKASPADSADNKAANIRATTTKQMKLSTLKVPGIDQHLVNELAAKEGIRLDAYYCSEGYLTVGIGHKFTAAELKNVKEGDVFSEAEVITFAKQDIGAALKDAQHQAAELGVQDDAFTMALVQVCFQLGNGWNTKFVKTWAYMKDHQWEQAAQEVAASKWYQQTQVRAEAFQKALRALSAKYPAKDANTSAWDQYKSAQGAKADIPPMPEGEKLGWAVQEKLHGMGLLQSQPDGKVGKKTKAAISAFQLQSGLKPTGYVDQATWDALHGKVKNMSFFGNHKVANSEKGHKQSYGVADSLDAIGWGERSKSNQSMPGCFVDSKYWRSQLDSVTGDHRAMRPGDKNCRYVASEMVWQYLNVEMPEMIEALGLDKYATNNNFGGTADLSEDRNSGFLRVQTEDKEAQKGKSYVKNKQFPDSLHISDQYKIATSYLDNYLGKNVPVVVGVNHSFARGINEGTTDHFVTLTGVGKDAKGKKTYFFFDPGRTTAAQGTSNEGKNQLVEVSAGIFKTVEKTGSSDAQTYYLSSVVIFPSDRKKMHEQLNVKEK